MDIFNLGTTRSSFVADLSIQDLNRLRAVCQKVHKENMVRAGKAYRVLPLHEVDKWIESMGPKVREKRIKIAVDKGAV
tara:strand:+ start:312 stop:545 length:234 start_codon:yes stop_codon:yes gene_type:complete